MAAGDYVKKIWVNNTTPAINQTNLNNIEDKITELDELIKRTNTIDFKDIKLYCMENNTKEISIFDNDSDWTANGSTLSDDTLNIDMHTQAVKILEPDNGAGICGMYQTFGSTVVLDEFQSGSTSTTSDLIALLCYVSDAAAVNYVEIILGDDSTDNYSETWSGLSTGWNVLTSAKSSFTTNNSPTGWDTIDYIAVNWYSNANYQNDYISFNHLTMIREDPDNSGYYNEFQYYDGSSYQNIFTNNLSQYFLYYDRKFGEIVLLKHTPGDDETELHLYCECIDFVAKVKMRTRDGTDTGNVLTWWVDADNYIEIYVEADTLKLFHREAAATGTETISMPIAFYEEIEYYVEKIGQTIKLIANHREQLYVIEYQTGISATDEGCIYFGGTGDDNYGLYTDFVFSNTQGHRLEQKWDRPVIKRKTADESVTSSTTLQDDDELYIRLPANSVIKIDLVLIAVSASATPDIKLSWTADGEYTILSSAHWVGPPTNMTDTDDTNMTLAYYNITTSVSFGMDGSANETPITCSFIILTHKDSVLLELYWAQNTSNATASTVEAGSYILATKLNVDAI